MKFRGNSEIIEFEEFQYFTGINPSHDNDTRDWFRDSANLVSLRLPLQFKHIVSCICYHCFKLESVNIPDGVLSIGDNAFNSTSLHEIVIPETCTLINDNAFYYCKNLAKATLNAVVIGDSTFRGCSALTSIRLGDRLETLKGRGIRECTSLNSIEFPQTLTYIGDAALYGNTALDYIIFHSTNPPELVNDVALKNTNNCIVYVPTESVTAYKTATNWSIFANRIKPMSEFTGQSLYK